MEDHLFVKQNNDVIQCDLKNNLIDYIKIKHKDYLYELQENKFNINCWRKLELMTAYKNDALMYEDVPEYIKNIYLLPSRDEGIDVIKINKHGEIISCYQCKDYRGRVENKELESFFKYQESNKFKNVEFILVGSLTTKFNSMFENVEYYDVQENFGTRDKINKKPFELRDYQLAAIKKIEDNYNNHIDRMNVKMPCGTGKSQIFYHFGSKTDLKILILVPKISIAQQIYNHFLKNIKKKINCYWSNTDKFKNKLNNSNVTVCVYKSVDYINDEYDIIFIDEAHHIVGSDIYVNSLNDSNIEINENIYQKTYISKIIELKSKLVVNLSATLDINTEYDFEYDFVDAIRNGYLVNYELNLICVDYDILNQFKTLVNIINTNMEYKHIIIYCNTIETSKRCCEFLNNNNIITYNMTHKTTKINKEHYLRDFKSGLIKVITTVNCMSEGVDTPIADTCIFLDDRISEINIVQSIGRIMRIHKFKNKARIVLLDTENDMFKINYYLQALMRYDYCFDTEINKRIKIYNYSSRLIDLDKHYKYYFEKIRHLKSKINNYTYKEKLIKCQEFYTKTNRYPRPNYEDRILSGFNIYDFVNNCRRNPLKKEEIEKIFGIKKQHTIIKTVIDNDAQMIAEFIIENGRFPRARGDIYKGFDVSKKYSQAKRGRYNTEKALKQKIEQLIGKPLPEIENISSGATDDEMFKAIEELYKRGGKMTNTTKTENGLCIGSFRAEIYRPGNKNQERMRKMKELDEKYNRQYVNVKRDDTSLDEWYEIIKRYYRTYNTLPSHNPGIIFENYDVGKFMNKIFKKQFRSRHEDYVKKIENIPKLFK